MRVGSLEIEIMAGMARLQKDMSEAQRIVGGSMSNIEKSVASSKRAMQALGVGLPLAAITDQVRRMTDQYTKLDAQLRLSTKSQAQYAQGMADIRRISTVAQADLSATSMLYTRLMNVMQGTGVEQSKLATVTETVSFGLKAYGATAQEASSAALQLSQAMGANRLGGEEFRATMEAMPNVMKVVADSMSKSEGRQILLGDLRQLSIDGKITADVLVKALGDPVIAANFKRLAESAQTITGAWVVARNELTLLVGEFMKSSGATGSMISIFKALTEAIMLAAKHIEQLVSFATIMAALYAGKFVAGLIQARMAQTALNAAHVEALAVNAAMAQSAVATTTATMASNAASIADATAKLAEADAIGLVAVAHYNATRSAEADIVAAQASRAATMQNLAAIGTEAAATKAAIASKGAAVSNALRVEMAAIMERRALAKIELAQIDASIAAHRAQAAANVVAEQRMTAAMAQRAAMHSRLIALEEAQTIAQARLTASTVEVAAAEKLQAAATLSWFGKLKDFASNNALGLIGLTLWGAYSIADHLGWVDTLFSRASKAVADLKTLAGENAVFAQAMSAADQKAALRSEDAARKRIAADLGIKVSAQATTAELIAATDAAIKSMEGAVTVRGAQFREDMQRLKDLRVALGQPLKDIAAVKERNIALAHDEEVMQKRMIELNKQFNDGNLTTAEYYKRVNDELWGATKAAKETTKAQKELNAMREASIEYDQDIIDGINAETDALLKKIEQERFDTEAIGKTKEQLALLQSVRYDNITALQEQKVAALEANFASEDEIAAIKGQIKARKELKAVWGTQAVAQAADAQRKAWKEVWDSVDKVAHDTFVSIMNGGKDTATRLKEAFKNGFFDWLYSMTAKKWIMNIGATASGVGASGAAMAGGGDGGVSSWLSIGNMLKTGITGLEQSFTMMAGEISGALQSVGVAAETAGSIGVAGSYVGAGLAGISIGSMLAGGKSLGGMSGTTTSAIGAIAGSIFAGPLGGVIGGAIGGALAGAFGRGAKQSGTTTLAGQFGAGGFAGGFETPWTQSGGWFSSGRSGVDTSPIGAAQAAAFKNVVGGTAMVFGKLIGLAGQATRSLDEWAFTINRQVATQEQQNQLIVDIADSMGTYLLPRLKEFRQQGENLADTAVRLTDEIILLDRFFATLGSTVMATMDTADALANALGGVASTAQAMTNFISAFAPETKQTELTLAGLKNAGLGMAEFLTTTEAWWNYAKIASAEQLTLILANQGGITAWIAAMQKSSQAVSDNIKALKDKAIADFNAARSATDSLRAFGVSVRELMASLWLGAQSPMSGGAMLGALRANFERTNALAPSDTTAQGSLAGAATSYLDAVRAGAVSALEYSREFAFVQNSLEATAIATESNVSIADQQLAQLQQANAWLSAISASSQAQSLAAALGTATTSAGAVNAAIGAQQAGIASQASSASVAIADATAASERNAQQQAAARAAAAAVEARRIAEHKAFNMANPELGYRIDFPEVDNAIRSGGWKNTAYMHYLQFGKGRGWSWGGGSGITGDAGGNPPGAVIDQFALGGAFTNGIVSRPTAFNQGEMGEVDPEAIMPLANVGGRLGVHSSGNNKVTNELLKKLIAANEEMRKELTAIRNTNYRMWQIEDEWNTNGTPEVREAA